MEEGGEAGRVHSGDGERHGTSFTEGSVSSGSIGTQQVVGGRQVIWGEWLGMAGFLVLL